MEAAFAMVQTDLDRVAARFARERGGQVDDLRSVAYEAFVDAESSWELDRSRSDWRTYTCNRAWWRLCDHSRRERRERRQAELGTLPASLAARGPGRLELLLAELGDDAATVCRLVLETPAELAEVMADGEPWACRKALRGFLASLGWTAGRALAAFSEIREALQ